MNQEILELMLKRHSVDIGRPGAAVFHSMETWSDQIPPDRAVAVVDFIFKQAAFANAKRWDYVEAVLKNVQREGWIISDDDDDSPDWWKMYDTFRIRAEAMEAMGKETSRQRRG